MRHFTILISLALALFATVSTFAGFNAGGGGVTSPSYSIKKSSLGFEFETQVSQSPRYRVVGVPIEFVFNYSGGNDPDDNGLPDDWEYEHFESTGVDPHGDPDHDGMSNVSEYYAGTDPRSSASVFRPLGAFSGSTFRLPFQTIALRSYRIWASKDLESWTHVTTYQGDGTAKVFVFDHSTIKTGPLHPNEERNSYFFKIQIILESP